MRCDEFFIGYEPGAPEGVRRRVRIAVAAIAVVAVVAAVTVTAVQRRLAPSSFAFGTTSRWTGYLVTDPAPSLLVPRGAGFQRLWLVARGKHGLVTNPSLTRTWVAVEGSEISREPWRMVEVARIDATSQPPNGGPPAPPDTPARPFAGVGEFVDSKCYLGVMNPGERIVHRDCAIRCLSGGVPPMFSFTGSRRHQLALVADAKGPIAAERLSKYVGRPVRVRGTLHDIEDGIVLRLHDVVGESR